MKRFLFLSLLTISLTACNKSTEVEETTTEVTTETTTETTTEEVRIPDELSEEDEEDFKTLNYSYTPADYVVDRKAQYACSYKYDTLYRIHPVIGGKEDITDYEEFNVHLSKGYMTVAPISNVKTDSYIIFKEKENKDKEIEEETKVELKIDIGKDELEEVNETSGDVKLPITKESIIYISDEADITFRGVILNSKAREGFLKLPIYTVDGVLHEEGFDTEKYDSLDITIDNYTFEQPNTYKPTLFETVEPQKLVTSLDGYITLTYQKEAIDLSKTYFMYNESKHSETGSTYTLYKKDKKIYEGILPAGCRIFIDFKDYDTIEIQCGIMVQTT